MRKIVLLLLLVSMGLYVEAQNRTITGVVTSQSKVPLTGASITIPGTNRGGVTNSFGIFSINVPATTTALQVSYLGYKAKTITVGAGNSLNITLETEQSELETLVVSAGGLVSRKRDLGYATTQINAEKLTAAKPTNLAAALTGKVAGLKNQCY